MSTPSQDLTATRVVVIGGGPGGYEAALVGRRLGADVTVVETTGLGGAAVLTDVVPSKTLIATAEWMTIADRAPELGIRLDGTPLEGSTLDSLRHRIDLAAVNTRVKALAAAQSADIRARLEREGVRIVLGHGRLDGPSRVLVSTPQGADDLVLDADVVLVATGATPRMLPEAQPDGERILTWTQLYDLAELPKKLIVVGSGVTGAEFAGAYTSLGAEVVLVSSRDRVLPGEDADAAELLEDVFKTRGMTVMSQSRAVRRGADRRRRRGDAGRRARRRGHARPVRGRLDPDLARARAGGGRRAPDAVRAHRGRQGLAHQRPRHLRRR